MKVLFMKPAAVALAAGLAAGCATTSAPPAPLQEARNAYSRAQSNPHVPRFAPVELNEAGKALNKAERLWREDANKEAVAHQAYLAEQRARIALNTAQARTARAEIERAEAERRGVIAQARRLEAEADRRQAELARDQTASQLAEAQREREIALTAQRQAEQVAHQMRKQLKELKARQTDRGWVLTLGSEVLFDVGDATLKPGARRAIDNLAVFLRDHPEQRVVIEGFTDNTGSSDFNLALSQERAQAVKRAIVRAGIDPQRIEARGHGEAFPVASNETIAGRQLNRRVEVVVPETMDGGSTGSGNK